MTVMMIRRPRRATRELGARRGSTAHPPATRWPPASRPASGGIGAPPALAEDDERHHPGAQREQLPDMCRVTRRRSASSRRSAAPLARERPVRRVRAARPAPAAAPATPAGSRPAVPRLRAATAARQRERRFKRADDPEREAGADGERGGVERDVPRPRQFGQPIGDHLQARHVGAGQPGAGHQLQAGRRSRCRRPAARSPATRHRRAHRRRARHAARRPGLSGRRAPAPRACSR